MELSAEEYARIVRGMTGIASSANGHENRRAPRVPQRGKVSIIPISPDGAQTPLSVQLHNLSSRGMAFFHNEPFKKGAQFLVHLARSAGDAVYILCSVAHCDSVSRDVYSTGAEFLCVANPPAVSLSEGIDQATRIRQSILG